VSGNLTLALLSFASWNRIVFTFSADPYPEARVEDSVYRMKESESTLRGSFSGVLSSEPETGCECYFPPLPFLNNSHRIFSLDEHLLALQLSLFGNQPTRRDQSALYYCGVR
jgi:hypothetical protein